MLSHMVALVPVHVKRALSLACTSPDITTYHLVVLFAFVAPSYERIKGVRQVYLVAPQDTTTPV